jgi:hypothetical protein
LKVSIAEVVAAVELDDFRNAALLGRVAPRIEDLPAHPSFLDAKLAAGTVERIGAMSVILGALEHRKHVVPRPTA